jgi:2-dehydropantoate 2-reductase
MAAERSIVVFGAGAVGGFLGGKLAGVPEGQQPWITLIGRPRVVEAVCAHGLILREQGLNSATRPQAASSARSAGKCDLVILAVRAFDVATSIPDVRTLIGESGLVLAMQNGVGSEEELAEALGRERMLAGTLTVSVGMEEPGVVTRYSRPGGVALSSMDGSAVPAWVVELFSASSLPTQLVADYRSLRWSKLLLNMLGAAVTAILDVNTSEVVRNPSLFRIEQLACREAGRVMDGQGIGTVNLPGYPVPLVRLLMRLPRSLAQRILGPRMAGARGGRAPTMRADLARGRSEVAYLNGAVVRAAERLGMETPVNAALTALVEQLVLHPERRAEFRAKPEALVSFIANRGVPL